MPAYRNKWWNGKIYLYNKAARTLYHGLVEHLQIFAKDRDYEVEFENSLDSTSFSLLESKEFVDGLKLSLEPRDYQIDGFVHAIRSKRSVIVSPTGSGKSLIAYLIAKKLMDQGLRGLILVPTTSLVEQMYSDFESYGLDVKENAHRIYSGKEKVSDKPLIISTWQSVYKFPTSYFEIFDFVIGDECHLYKAKSLTDIMTKLVNAKYRIGMTGTLDGQKVHKLILEGLFGPTRKVVSTKELIDKKQLANFRIKCLVLKHTKEECKAAKDFKYIEEMRYLVSNEKRNKFIRNLALSLDKNTLILFQYVEKHGKILHEMIEKKAKDRKVFFVFGNTDTEVREEIRQIMEKESNAIVVASFGVYSTGINIRNLHNIIFASPTKSKIRSLQSIGRGLRTNENKDVATLFDISDDLRHGKKENFTLKHFYERVKIYDEESFPYKLYMINLE